MPARRSRLAPVQGDFKDDRPAERRPGTKEHLGSDRPYEGEPSPYVEGAEQGQQAQQQQAQPQTAGGGGKKGSSGDSGS